MSEKSRLIQYALQFKKPIIIGIILLIFSVVTELAGPYIAKFIIDEYMSTTMIDYQPIILLLALFLGLGIISAVFRYFMYVYLQSGANRIVQALRGDVFHHLQTLPIYFFDNTPAGKIVARVTNDTEAIRNLYVQVLSQFLTSFISIFGVYVALFLLNVKIGFISLMIIPLVYIWMILYRKFASLYNSVIRTKIADINGMLNESINGITIIQAFQREKQVKNEFEQLNDEHFQYQRKLLILDSTTSYNLVGMLRLTILAVIILYFGHSSISTGSLYSAGLLYAIVDYITRLFNPIVSIVSQFSQIERSFAASRRVFELLDEKGVEVSTKSVERFKGDVAFENVSFRYTGDEYVLKNISFSAKRGQTIGIVGHTGSGKSSIMNLLFRYYEPQKGKIYIDGIDISTLPVQTIREHMGIVLQDPYLFTGTIESNISLEDPRISKEQVKEALAKVGGNRVLKNLEKGLDEPVLENGSTLSTGQRQLISFARALAFNPAILILDEATSNIDTETEEIIQQAMDVLKEGRTTFIIAHRLSTIKNADLILVLDRGEIVERGTHEELIERKGRYEKMYRLQSNA